MDRSIPQTVPQPPRSPAPHVQSRTPCIVLQIAHVVKTKTGEECVEFYYVWKMSSHYPQWKATYVQTYGDIEDQL
jgi:hypothetical protein